MAYENIQFEVKDSIATITLNRPESFNALTHALAEEVGQALQRIENDPAVRVVVITGAGRAFCAGGDVKGFVESLEGSPDEFIRTLADTFHRQVILPIRNMLKPVLGAVNGTTAGGGMGLMLALDYRVASEKAKFTMAYANIATTGDGSTTFFLPRLVGLARATELYLLTDPFDAQRALDLGLVNKVVPEGEVLEATLAVARRLAQGPTLAYGRVKALLNRSFSQDLTSQLDDETTGMILSSLTEDFREGVTAFAGKRAPQFRGR